MQHDRTLRAEGTERYTLRYLNGIVYAKRPTRDLTMRIITPHRVPPTPVKDSGFSMADMAPEFGAPRIFQRNTVFEKEPLPALIFLCGSGFGGDEGYAGLPTLCDIARAGFVVANIDYRGARRDNTTFPDCIQDCKEAVRFLRANAAEYGIDPGRIAIMGTSSGGYASLMTAFTMGDPAYEIGENLGVSSAVQAVIDLFGPVDFETIVEDRKSLWQSQAEYSIDAYFLFRNDAVRDPSLLKKASVLKKIVPERGIPLVLILHGDADKTMPVRQSARLYEALKAAGKDATFYMVEGAGHEINFWCQATVGAIKDFLVSKL